MAAKKSQDQLILERSNSYLQKLSDLHVYVVPVDIWRERFNNLLNQSVTETVSLGIIRVPPDMRLVDVREEIVQQLEGVAPQDYVFLRSCGRSLTRLKSKQEYQLKVKHCLPPVAYAPELFLLESSALNYGSDTDSRSQSSMRQLHVSDRDTPHGHRGYGSFRDGYRSPGNKSFREKDGYSGRDNHDRYGQPDKWRSRSRRNKNGETDHQRALTSRTDRSGDRASPYKHTTSLPKINPTSPTESRGPTPEFEQSGAKWSSSGPAPRQSRYETQDPYSDRSDRSRGPGDPLGTARQSHPSGRRDGYDGPRRADINKYGENFPPDDRREEYPDYRDKPQETPRREAKQTYSERVPYDSEKGPPTSPRSHPRRVDRSSDYGGKDRSDNYNKLNQSDPEQEGPGDEVGRSDNAPPSPTGQPRSSKSRGRFGPQSTSYTTNTNDDSGIAELSPDDHYRTGNRDNYNEENERRRRDLQNRLNRDRVDADQQDDDLLDDYRFEDIADRDQIDRERFEHDDEYRHQWVEEEKRKREEERRRKDDGRYDHDGDPDRDRTSDQDRSPDRNRDKSQDRGRNRYDDRKKMERTASDDELARYPSPPELRMQSPLQTERLTTSARQRKKDEKEKLLKDLEAARESRKNTEREREELVKKAKQLQSKTQNRRNHARDVWKKRYFEEKKKTPPLEEQMNRMRQELDAVHRKLMITLEGPKEKNVRFGDVKPSLKNNYVIQCTRLQHEIEDLRRRVENAKMKLTAEMKLRNQAEAELRALRAELTQKKITLTLARNQQFAALSPVIEPIPQAPMTSRG
ncbi:zinc finger CCCH domain-containing protein 13-like [Gigantopelta aegis]|uniref:zinc finger CCCH domain-containing protein 13-like n=1 Tax=Gigantopelta aegis TaxID=1735272 RepID=UPI001B888F5C|nr:zinc finger CCCH domain-containing protein 13-like [Gigantopelta aegis]